MFVAFSNSFGASDALFMTYVQEAVRFSGWGGSMLVRATKIKLQRKVGLVTESMFRFMFPRLQRIYGGSE